MRFVPILTASLVLVGCTSTAEREYEGNLQEYQRMIASPTPSVWAVYQPWKFVLLDNSDKVARVLTLEFTDLPAETCSSGDWRQARIVEQEPTPESASHVGYTKEPAYILQGSFLLIDLHSNLCDAGFELRGELTNLGVSGKQQTVHIFGGETMGTFVGVPADT